MQGTLRTYLLCSLLIESFFGVVQLLVTAKSSIFMALNLNTNTAR
jgi:hypothetical protein